MSVNKLSVIGIVLVIAIFSFKKTNCAKILAIFPAPGYSQYLIGARLMVPLAEKGHEVTMIAKHETKGIKNFRNIIIKSEKLSYESPAMLYEMLDNNILKNIDICYDYGIGITETALGDEQVQRLINSKNETFDLVIAETILNEALYAFALHFKTKLILVNTMGLTEYSGYFVGNPVPPSYTPTLNSGFTSIMNFNERLQNTFGFLYDLYKRKFYGHPKHQSMINEYFPKQYDLQEAIDKVSLLMLNSHPSVTGVLPLTHAVKEIGGFHIKSQPLPKDIKAFLDNATKGAILFSMGSNIKSSDIPKPVVQRILEDFSKLDQKVLWKFESPNFENIPPNILISRWLPQADIIAHPNVAAFISHGGLLSTIETTYYGVPIIGVPVFVDQHTNVKRTVDFGAGIYLSLKKLGHGSLQKVVNEVISNPKYKEKAVQRSKLLRDRVIPPVDEAVYWIEYILRCKDTKHLRSRVLDLNWFQVYLLDIGALFIIIFLGLALIVTLLIKVVCVSIGQNKVVKGNKKNR